MLKRSVIIARITAAAFALCLSVQAFAGVASSSPPSTPLTVPQAREAQALLGFDMAIPHIVKQSIEIQPEFQSMTPTQRTCVFEVISPVFQQLIDDAFIELFGDAQMLASWTSFSMTPGGKVFIEVIRQSVRSKVSGGPEPDAASMFGGMGDSEKADVAAFMSTPASQIMNKGFPELDLPAEMEKSVLTRIESTCGVAPGKL